jgi:hypothetical protein
MLRGLHLTGGIGVKTARSIPCKSTKDVLDDHNMTFVIGAEQRKVSKTAHPEVGGII